MQLLFTSEKIISNLSKGMSKNESGNAYFSILFQVPESLFEKKNHP